MTGHYTIDFELSIDSNGAVIFLNCACIRDLTVLKSVSDELYQNQVLVAKIEFQENVQK